MVVSKESNNTNETGLHKTNGIRHSIFCGITFAVRRLHLSTGIWAYYL